MATIKDLMDNIYGKYSLDSIADLVVPKNSPFSLLEEMHSTITLPYRDAFDSLNQMVAGTASSEAVEAALGLATAKNAIASLTMPTDSLKSLGSLVAGFGLEPVSKPGSAIFGFAESVNQSIGVQGLGIASGVSWLESVAKNTPMLIGSDAASTNWWSDSANLIFNPQSFLSEFSLGHYIDPFSQIVQSARSGKVERIDRRSSDRNIRKETVESAPTEVVLERVQTVVNIFNGPYIAVSTNGNSNLVVVGDGNDVNADVKVFGFDRLKRDLFYSKLSDEELEVLTKIIEMKKTVR